MAQDMSIVEATLDALGEQHFSGPIYYEWKEGQNLLRILPPVGSRTQFWEEFQQCWNVGPEKKVIIPGSADSCPMRAYLSALKAKKDDLSKKEFATIRPKDRAGFFVIDRSDPGKGPQFVNANKELFRDILTIMADSEYGDITDPVKGTDLKITYTPKTKTADGFPKWDVLASRTATPLGDDAWIAEDLYEKYTVGRVSDPDYINAVLTGTAAKFIESRRAARAAENAGAGVTQPPGGGITVLPPGSPEEAFWTSKDAKVAEMNAAAICEVLRTGGRFDGVQPKENGQGWKTPEEYGFKTLVPQPAPTAPPSSPGPAPAAAPAPAVSSAASPAPAAPATQAPAGLSEEELALERQLAELRARKAAADSSAAPAPSSAVAKEIQLELAKS